MIRYSLAILVVLFSIRLFAIDQSAGELNASGVEKSKKGEYTAAHDDFGQSIELSDGGGAIVYHNLGVSYEKEGKLLEAARSYEEAIRRNPKQIVSYEKAGYLYYKLGHYNKAYEIGKAGLAIDPKNESIPTWLYASHKKKYKEEKEDFEGPERTLKYREPYTFSIGAAVTPLIGINNSPFSVEYVENPGLGVSLTSLLYLEYCHKGEWGVRARIENPYYGTLLSDTLLWYEKLEWYFRGKDFYAGAGFLGAHYEGDQFFGSNQSLWDWKIGFIYGYEGKKNSVTLNFYPKIILADNGFGDDRTMDVSSIEGEWVHAYGRLFDLYFGLAINEAYYYDNIAWVSDYEGTYDFSGGVVFFNDPASHTKIYTYLTERLYMKNLDNEKPYDAFNGQGNFGLDMGNWFYGAPFSGINTFSQLVSARFVHNLHKNIMLFEEISFEIVPLSQKRHGISATVGGEIHF